MRKPTLADSLALESLEARRLLSADLSPEGVLVLTGTDQGDTMSVEAGDAAGQVVVFGVEGVTDGTVFEGVNSLRLRLLGGNDTGSIVGSPLDTSGAPLDTIMFGSRGNDTLIGGDGPVTLKGGGGADSLFGAGPHACRRRSASDRAWRSEGARCRPRPAS